MEKISIEDFKKLNLVIGTIIAAEELPGSEKLYRFEVDLGNERRQIIGGFKIAYTVEELLNRQVVVLENLQPRKLMSLESQGMILAAGDGDGKPVIIQPLKKVENGAIIK